MNLYSRSFAVTCIASTALLVIQIHANAQSKYTVAQITTGPVDHRWPAVSDDGTVAWCQPNADRWQVYRNGAPITSASDDCRYPAINDTDTVYTKYGVGGGVGRQVIKHPNTVVEFSSRDRFSGAHRDAGEHSGISEDGKIIWYYDWWPFAGFKEGRRLFVSGLGQIMNDVPGDFPDINSDGVFCYSANGSTYVATTAAPNSVNHVLSGDNPRINGTGDIVTISGARVTVYHGPDYKTGISVHTGVWADINKKGEIVFEDFKDGFRQIFKATPVNTVLLVHGTWSNAKDPWVEMTQGLKNANYAVDTIDMNKEPEPNSNEASPRLQAIALGRKIKDTLGDNDDGKIDLVCHSLGGLAARWYLHDSSLWPRPDNAGVRKLILIGTPNWGTDLELLNPILAVAIAHNQGAEASVKASGLPYPAHAGFWPTDTIYHWSPGLQDMYAEWMPPPVHAITGPPTPIERDSYPSNYSPAMGKWIRDPSQYFSPIAADSWTKASGIAVDTWIEWRHPGASEAVNDAQGIFPHSKRLLYVVHQQYYTSQAPVMGNVLVPDPTPVSPVIGVNTRHVSRFLAELNGSVDLSGAKVYLIAGTKPVTYEKIGIPLIPAPFTIPNDGVVPYLSALGIEPITGASLFPGAKQLTIYEIHIGLEHNAQVVQAVVSWLNE